MGLAIVRHLMDLHEGSVEVHSEGKNRGSTFTISLPLIPADVSAQGTTAEAVLLQKTEMQPFGSVEVLQGLRVLVVDDEPDARDLLSTILKRYGSDVRCSESAADAIEAFSEWEPDILVSDIGMPDEDGYTLIKKVRQLDSNRAQKIPAVALTAYATDEDRMRALDAGFQTHVAKPIEPEIFVTSIASVLKSLTGEPNNSSSPE